MKNFKFKMTAALALAILPQSIFAAGKLPTQASDASVKIMINGIEQRVPEDLGKAYLDKNTQRIMVPFRFISESLGLTAEMKEENSKRLVICKDQNSELTLTIGEKSAKLEDKNAQKTDIINFDAAPIIYDSRTYAPLRVVSEAMKAKVDWQKDANGAYEIKITKEVPNTNVVKADPKKEVAPVAPTKVVDPTLTDINTAKEIVAKAQRELGKSPVKKEDNKDERYYDSYRGRYYYYDSSNRRYYYYDSNGFKQYTDEYNSKYDRYREGYYYDSVRGKYYYYDANGNRRYDDNYDRYRNGYYYDSVKGRYYYYDRNGDKVYDDSYYNGYRYDYLYDYRYDSAKGRYYYLDSKGDRHYVDDYYYDRNRYDYQYDSLRDKYFYYDRNGDKQYVDYKPFENLRPIYR